MLIGAAKLQLDRHQALKVMADVEFVRHAHPAHPAMQLDRLLPHKTAGLANYDLCRRYGKAAQSRIMLGLANSINCGGPACTLSPKFSLKKVPPRLIDLVDRLQHALAGSSS